MRVYNLFQEFTWEKVKPFVKKRLDEINTGVEDKEYKYRVKPFQGVFEIAKTIEYNEEINDKLEIGFIENDEKYPYVLGRKENDSINYSYIGWEDWLALEIDKSIFKKYSKGKIIALVMWEMTWDGFTPPKRREENASKI